MPDATWFADPDVTPFCRLERLGLVLTGQRVEPDRTVLACRVAASDDQCRRCRGDGVARDTVVRRVAHEPYLYPRMVVGWAIADNMRAPLVCQALRMAHDGGYLAPKAVFHSDRGSQHTSREFARTPTEPDTAHRPRQGPD